MKETAYAKINLALHIRKRRDDGYHQIETLFAFVDAGDELTAREVAGDALTIFGEFAPWLTDPFGNIVSKALGKLPRKGGLSINLEKNLPVAAGLGGGSADAGAIFRIVRELYGLPGDWRERASDLGADVPACVQSVTCIGRGTGTQLEPIESDLTGIPVLLVNPREPLLTGPVFAAWDGSDRGPLPTGPVSKIARDGRNDLQTAAISQRPVIMSVLEALNETSAFLARMSGSGASCFALFADIGSRDAAAQKISADHPGWWLMKGKLR